MPQASIVISSHNRLELFRRTLWAINDRPPPVSFELIVVDDGSSEPVLDELRLYSNRFEWSFISVDMAQFEAQTGVRKFFNNPSLTSNVGVRHARGEWIFQQGNEVIPFGNCYDELLFALQARDNHVALSTTYNVPKHVLIHLDKYGANFDPLMLDACRPWVLGSDSYRSDVTNYLSLCSRKLFEGVGGYDERYLAGVGGEDSDFVRRCRAYGASVEYCAGVSLHQDHGGRTRYSKQDQALITDERWRDGERVKWEIYDSWRGEFYNPQSWEWGQFGVANVTRNWSE